VANATHMSVLLAGSEAWTDWRRRSGVVKPDLAGADLSPQGLKNTRLMEHQIGHPLVTAQAGSGASLAGFDLSAVDLRYANLSMADLSGAQLTGTRLGMATMARARLDHANLTHAELQMTQLTRASAVGADFRYADLSYTVLAGVNLRGARFADVTMVGCLLSDLDLSETLELDAVLHLGPSSLGIDTLLRSGGHIPPAFLRGVGLSKALVANLQQVGTATAGQYASCFISYANADLDFARPLYSDLRENGVLCWFAPEDLKGGRDFRDQIRGAIREHDRVLLLLSRHSMRSEWVKTEVLSARDKERRSRNRVLFPIALVPFKSIRSWEYIDPDTGEDIGRVVRELHVSDFSDWQDPVAYRAAFERLTRDLKS